VSTLKYKDYQGSVSFEDGQLIIQILHIDDFITTECDSASGAQQAFEALVEDYVETCKAMEKEPSKPFKGTFNVRISPNLHRIIAMAAMDADETMNAWIANALQEKVDRQKSAKRIFDPLYISRMTEGVAAHYSTVVSRPALSSHDSITASAARKHLLLYEMTDLRPMFREAEAKYSSRNPN
jgi:predicted HicB family RNase H-like nuclease